MQKQIDVQLTTTAQKLYQALQDNYPIIVSEGGSSSGKTFGCIQILITIALTKPLQRITIVSHSLPHLKRGCIRDFKIIMDGWQLWNDEYWSATNFIYEFANGSYIEFIGLEDEAKARGARRDYLFINEANLVEKRVFDQLAMRTAVACIIDLNPADFKCWCYDVADNPKNKAIHSTYKDNLQNLSENQIAYIESYKDLPDDFMWKVYGLGLRGASKDLIYTSWKRINELPANGEVIYGLDFGFVAPMAMVKIVIYDNCLHVEEMLYRSGMTISDVGTWLKGMNLGKSIIYCDNAEPKSIEELRRYGLNAKAADKDVWAGILKIKSMPLYICNNSINLLNEIASYKWKKNGNDELIEEPVKLNDHLLDAMRYAVFTHLHKPQIKWISV